MKKDILSNLKICIFLSSITILIDFFTKKWIINNMFLHEIKLIIPCLNLLYERNYGIAFSFLSKNNNLQKWFIIILVVIVITFIIIKIYYNHNKFKNISYSLIIGGALGNLTDRINHGFVIDFIDFHISNWHFATFNFADFSICIGTLFLIKELNLSKEN